MAGDALKPEPKFLSGTARWVLVVLITSLLSLFYYVSSGDSYAAIESTSGLSATHVLGKAARKALNGGVAGFAAGLAQVLLFMWMRTVMNYQYAHGGTAVNAFRQLYADGGGVSKLFSVPASPYPPLIRSLSLCLCSWSCFTHRWHVYVWGEDERAVVFSFD